jgi:hypothetical protein
MYAAVTKNEDNPPQADRWTLSDSLLVVLQGRKRKRRIGFDGKGGIIG